MTRLSVDLAKPLGHVTQYSFGLRGRPRGGALDKLYAETGAIRPTTAELMLREAYLIDYEIRPPNAPYHPLDVVRLYDKEDVVEGGAVRSLMRKYHRYDIKGQWNLSWNEFKELPFDEAMFMIEMGEHEMMRKINEQNRVKRDMDREVRDMTRQL